MTQKEIEMKDLLDRQKIQDQIKKKLQELDALYKISRELQNAKR